MTDAEKLLVRARDVIKVSCLDCMDGRKLHDGLFHKGTEQGSWSGERVKFQRACSLAPAQRTFINELDKYISNIGLRGRAGGR